MVEILDQTQAHYAIQPAETVQQLLRYVPEGDLAGLDRIVLLDQDAEAKGMGRLGLYRLVSAEQPTARRAKHAPAKAEREIVLLFGLILGQERRKLQATILLAATLFQQIGQHVLARRPLAPGSSREPSDRQEAEHYADRLLWPLIREQTVRGQRLPSLAVLLSLVLGIASLFVTDPSSNSAMLLALIVILTPLLLLNAGGAYRPSTKRLIRPILLLWVALVWGATAVFSLLAASDVRASLAFGLGLVSLALGLGIASAGGLGARFWWARPIGPVRPPLAIALFGVALLTSVAPWLHLAMLSNAALTLAGPLWALIGAASVALASAFGWWLFADLRQDALEASAAAAGDAAGGKEVREESPAAE
jgi:hypothetical protein